MSPGWITFSRLKPARVTCDDLWELNVGSCRFPPQSVPDNQYNDRSDDCDEKTVEIHTRNGSRTKRTEQPAANYRSDNSENDIEKESFAAVVDKLSGVTKSAQVNPLQVPVPTWHVGHKTDWLGELSRDSASRHVPPAASRPPEESGPPVPASRFFRPRKAPQLRATGSGFPLAVDHSSC
jgi:hypothetical protein